MISQLDVPTFTIGRVAAAAGVPVAALATNLRRGYIALATEESVDSRHPGTGQHRLFSPRRALHIALTMALVRAGIWVKQASNYALAFSDHTGSDSDQYATIVGGDEKPAPSCRQPCKLYDGATWFRVMFRFGKDVPAVSVDRGSVVLANPFLMDNSLYESVVIVDLNAVAERVLGALGLPVSLVR